MRLPLATRLEASITLARRGMMPPMRPDRLVRSALALRRWGSSLAAAYVVHAIDAKDGIALADDNRALTYGEVDIRTNALARGLAKLAVGEANPVGILCRNSAAFVESGVACAKLGADVLLLNTSLAAPELAAVVEREQPCLLIHDREFGPLVAGAGLDRDMARLIADGLEEAAGSPKAFENLVWENDNASLDPPERESRWVILTSGTTGVPKGARVARASSIDPLAWFLRIVPLRARSVCQISAPLFHAHGFGQLVIGAGLGCKLVLPKHFDPQETLATIERHQVQALVAVPLMLKRIMELPIGTRSSYDTSSLEVVISSGSALVPELTQAFTGEFGPVLYNLYGSTEVAWATIATPDDLREAPGTVGRPPPHTRLAILDQDGHLLPSGETGRIFVGHEMLFEGYTNKSQRVPLEDGMIATGDLGHLDAEGRLFVDAREDEMIVSGGENVYPGEVEIVLAEHDDIEDVAAVGVPDEQFGERFVVFVVPRQARGLTSEDVIRYAKERLARYKQPRAVVLVEELPRNALGKVLKNRLRQEQAPTGGAEL